MSTPEVPALHTWQEATHGVLPPNGIPITDWLDRWGTYAGYAGVIHAALEALAVADAITTPEHLDALPIGSVVHYTFHYDFTRHALAERGGDGRWYDPTLEEPVTPFLPARVIQRGTEAKVI